MWRASSSCSDAAVALARSLFRKGADFTAAMAFEMATANLVLELSIIMLALLGWQLTLAQFVGAPLMVVLLVLLFRMFLSREGRPRRNGHVRHGGTSLARASAGAPRKATGHCLRLCDPSGLLSGEH
jgi:uncharacterized membrane protein YraQ (UPF0718 family)